MYEEVVFEWNQEHYFNSAIEVFVSNSVHIGLKINMSFQFAFVLIVSQVD